MKFFRLALVLSAAAICALHAQDDEKQQKAPTEIPDFNNLDEYIYVPKSTLNYGFRYTSGVKAHFSGKGQVPSVEPLPDRSAPNISRTYHDGEVGPDTRSVQSDNGNGTGSSVTLNSVDGKTNNYAVSSTDQITPDGFLTYHLYSATTDNVDFNQRGKGNAGTEVFVAKDMKKLTKHWEWKIFGGASVNDIQASSAGAVTAHITTTTDTYDTYGQTPSTSGASTTSTINVVDGNGNAVLDALGNPQVLSVSNTVLISNAPLARGTSTSTDAVSVLNQYKLHGAYVTFRAGPQIIYNFTDHMKVELSAGPALIFAGSTYQVNEVFAPATGSDVVDTLTDTTNKLLLGYYADATFEYDITERTGFYLGAFDQSAGSYKQSANSPFGLYSTNVDFSNQEGIRTGLSYKF
jgi:hypothetical protein